MQAATAELAQQNELLRRQAIELEQASRLKSQFLANMSHEFRTPLNAILGYTHMLLQGVAGDLLPAVRRQLTRIDSNGRHLLQIINEILDITRIEAGKMPLQISRFNVNELVPEVMAELDAVIARSKLSVTPRLNVLMPEVTTDRQKVKQIVVNLLSNALKFTHQGGIELAVGYEGAERVASIAVRDTGIGIAPENHEKVFEDFRQVDDSPSRQYRRNRPRPRDLPAARSHHRRPHHAAQPSGRRVDVHAHLPGQRGTMTDDNTPLILVVDDYQDAREMYAEYLQFSGFRVAEAKNGNEAIEKAFELRPALILMDLSLPGMDGWEATRQLKSDERTRHIPVVALTGHALAGASEGARKAGCDSFVTKPCLPDDLVVEVRRMLNVVHRQV